MANDILAQPKIEKTPNQEKTARELALAKLSNTHGLGAAHKLLEFLTSEDIERIAAIR